MIGKKQSKALGVGTLEVRITAERRSYYISTGIRVRKSEWKAGQIVNRPDSSTLNERLAIIYEIVSDSVNGSIKAGEAINTEAIRSKVYQASEAMSDEPCAARLDRGTDTTAESRGRDCKALPHAARLIEYGDIKTWQDVTPEKISQFDAWLHQRKTVNGDRISDAVCGSITSV